MAGEHRLPERRRYRTHSLLTKQKGRSMFSVIFEVLPAERKKDEYLALAKHLKPILESIDGFVDDERYESQRRPVARLAAHLGLDANGGAVVDHDVWTSILIPGK